MGLPRALSALIDDKAVGMLSEQQGLWSFLYESA